MSHTERCKSRILLCEQGVCINPEPVGASVEKVEEVQVATTLKPADRLPLWLPRLLPRSLCGFLRSHLGRRFLLTLENMRSHHHLGLDQPSSSHETSLRDRKTHTCYSSKQNTRLKNLLVEIWVFCFSQSQLPCPRCFPAINMTFDDVLDLLTSFEFNWL